MTDKTLLPCPFCGCEVRMRVHTYLGEWHTVRGEHAPSCPMRKVWRNYADEAEAIQAWNNRADTEYGSIPATEENMARFGWVRERTCEYVGDEVSGGCSVCRGWLDPACAYCPSCGAKVVGE